MKQFQIELLASSTERQSVKRERTESDCGNHKNFPLLRITFKSMTSNLDMNINQILHRSTTHVNGVFTLDVFLYFVIVGEIKINISQYLLKVKMQMGQEHETDHLLAWFSIFFNLIFSLTLRPSLLPALLIDLFNEAVSTDAIYEYILNLN